MKEIILFISCHPVLSILWITLLVAVLFTTFNILISKVKIVTRAEAIRLINKENAIVVDLRQYNDFYDAHIAGSINIMPTEIQTNKVGDLKNLQDKPIIVVDDTGIKVQEVANRLIEIGFKDVSILKDGIFGWTSENLPLVRGK